MVATYRLNHSKKGFKFYSQTQFSIRSFLNTPGVKLEIGRVCIAPTHRNGLVLNLIWKSLGIYAKSIRADYLFGCTSISSIDQSEMHHFYHYLNLKNLNTNHYNIRPKQKLKYKKTTKQLII